MARKFTSVNGITIHVCRKIAGFGFGPANVLAVRCNYPEVRYDIYIKEVEGLENQIKWFKTYWGIGFHIIQLPEEEVRTIPSTHGNTEVPA